MKRFSFFAAIAIALQSITSGAEITIDEVFRRCKGVLRKDVEPCVIKLSNDMRPLFEKGIPEFDLPSLTTFPGDDFEANEGGGPNSYINAKFYNITVKGLDEMQIRSLQLDYTHGVSRWTVSIPEYLLSGRYEMDAQILFVPLKGNGTFWFRVVDVTLTGTTNFTLDGPPNKDESRLQILETDVDFTYSNVSAKLNNLYRGEPILEQAADAFLNENTDHIVEEVKPNVRRNLAQNGGGILRKVFARIPAPKLAGSHFFTSLPH